MMQAAGGGADGVDGRRPAAGRQPSPRSLTVNVQEDDLSACGGRSWAAAHVPVGILRPVGFGLAGTAAACAI
jgi:hypothetical protein